jgi:hypothetical protein
MAASRTIEIDERYQGIPGIALGGYVGGLLARGAASAEVTLRRPVKTGRLLRMHEAEDGTSALLDGDEVLASACPARVALDVPSPVSWEESVAASGRSLQLSRELWHPFPRCLTCGVEREDGDGLRLFAGPVAGRDLVSAAWTPHAASADESGNVHAELVWAALDCPTIMALVFGAQPDSAERVVTGRLSVFRPGPVRAGEPHVVVAWSVGREGRALIAGGAIWSPHGDIVALARHTLVPASWGVPLDLDAWRR